MIMRELGHGTMAALVGAAAHPETMAWWETQPEAWAAHGENLRDPEEAMPAYVAWLESVTGKPDFVGYPAGFGFSFTCWYLIRFAGGIAVLVLFHRPARAKTQNFRVTHTHQSGIGLVGTR